MTFSDYSHQNFAFDFDNEEYIANATLSKGDKTYYQIAYADMKDAYDYVKDNNGDIQEAQREAMGDLVNLRENPNPTIKIYQAKLSYDEFGDILLTQREIFSGTLEEAKQDERFKDFDIKENVRQSEMEFANEQDFERENEERLKREQEREQTQEQTRQNSQENTQNQENSRQNSQERDNVDENINDYTTQTKEERKQEYSNFERRTAYEQGLNGFDDIREQNQAFDNLNKAYDYQDKIDKEMEENQKAIEEKEREIALKQKKLEEERNKKEQEFKDGKINDDDPLEKAKDTLRELQEKQKKLEEDKIKCKQAIQDAIGDMFAAKDIYDLVKNLLIVYRKIKEARQINETLKLDKERMQKLDEKINGFANKINLALQKAGAVEEAKEFMYELTKDLHDDQKKSKEELQTLRKKKEYCDELNILFKQRKNTSNLDRNTDEIEKMMKKIQKETPDFEKHYNTSFKQAMGIIKDREQGKTQSQSQYQGRSA